MEINGTNPLVVSKSEVQRLESSNQPKPVSKGGEEQPGSDCLELSVRSREVARITELAKSLPDVREDRVEKVRRQLESGAYEVKAEKIAEKMIKGNLLDEVF